MDRCTVNDGTKLNAYDVYRQIVNGIREALLTLGTVWNWGATNLDLALPNVKWVIPLINEGSIGIQEVPPKKFWALRIAFGGKIGPWLEDLLGMNIALPKQSIDQLWHALVANVDYFVPQSLYWPFVFEAGDTLKPEFGAGIEGNWYQGIMYNPEQQWGILSDGPKLLLNLTIFAAIIALFQKLGLFKVANELISKWFNRRRHQQLINEANENEELLNQLNNTLVTEADGIKTAINSTIGVRMQLFNKR